MLHTIKIDDFEINLGGVNASVRARQAIEVQIASAFINAALLAGYRISVDNGEDETEYFASKKQIMKAMFQTDEDMLLLNHPTIIGISWVQFVYGNDGWDVISDYTTDLEPLMQGEVKRLQDEFSS